MNEDQMRRIRERQEQLDELQRERRQELRHEIHRGADLDEAFSTAWNVVLPGMIPSVLWILWTAFGTLTHQPFAFVGCLCLGTVGLGLFVIPAALASGWLAHWWFRDSGISTRRMATVLALLADAVLFGWVLVLTHL